MGRRQALELLLSPFLEDRTVVPRQLVDLHAGSSLGLGVTARLVLSSGSLLGSPGDEEGAAALGGSASGAHRVRGTRSQVLRDPELQEQPELQHPGRCF